MDTEEKIALGITGVAVLIIFFLLIFAVALKTHYRDTVSSDNPLKEEARMEMTL